MKSFIVATLFALSACAVGVAPSSNDAGVDPDAGIQGKTCRINNVMYQVDFHRVSGDCPGAVDESDPLWIDANGKPVFPTNCVDHSKYDPCTTYLYEDCKSMVYDSEIYGQLNWSADGKYAFGNLTFSVSMISDGSYFCSSVYKTDYVYQWQAAQ